jgi:glycosyltransferase involved in cell wall biosynthesis
MEALNNNGVKAKMLVRDKETDRLTVAAVPGQKGMQGRFLWERLVVWLRLHMRREHLFEVDIANCGADITQLREFQEADVIHLHWVNQGMLSLKQIRKILDSGKRVVWTMHDIWPATAICHLTLDCRQFETECKDCPLTTHHSPLTPKIWKKKQQMLEGRRLTFVACSEWLAGEARRSALLKGQTIISIPNPIDTRVFKPGDKLAARRALGLPEEGKMILFVAQRATNPYKGMQYLASLNPSNWKEVPELLILGGHAEELESKLSLKCHALGYISDEQRMVLAYQAADVFVLPSLSENLPNTIMEAMACGVPCVGFRVGGIPEEILHQKNGYVAAYRDSEDLARGIHWVLEEADYDALSKACVSHVAENYSQQSVAKRYLEAYGMKIKD